MRWNNVLRIYTKKVMSLMWAQMLSAEWIIIEMCESLLTGHGQLHAKLASLQHLCALVTSTNVISPVISFPAAFKLIKDTVVLVERAQFTPEKSVNLRETQAHRSHQDHTESKDRESDSTLFDKNTVYLFLTAFFTLPCKMQCFLIWLMYYTVKHYNSKR